MKRIVFKEEVLSSLPLPEAGYKTLGVSDSGELSTIDSAGNIEPVGGTGSGGSSVLTQTKVSVSNPELLAINTTPKTIIAAPGAGKFIFIHSTLLRVIPNTTSEATNFDQTMVLGYSTDSTGTTLSYTTSELAWGDAEEIIISMGWTGDPIVLSAVNDSVILTSDVGDFVEFDGTMDIHVTYEIITL